MMTTAPVLPDESFDQPTITDPTLDHTDRPGRRWRARTIAELVVLIAAMARLFSTEIAGVVTNDSVGYLTRSQDLNGAGFIAQGYRQVAYPATVRVADTFGSIFGWDRILSVAILQRGVLLIGVVLLWHALRLWATPILLVVTSETLIIHADFVLPEGILIPGCTVAAGLAATVVRRPDIAQRWGHVILGASVGLAMWMGAVKLQYAALLLLAAAIAWILIQDRIVSRRFAVTSLAIGFGFFAVLSLVQSIENQRELGAFEPVSERIRAEWYGGWMAIFRVHPENASDPALAEYYAEGNLYTFMHGTERSVPDYGERTELFHERIDAMFDAADTTHFAQQVASFRGAIEGGRTDDLAGIVNRVRDDTSPVQLARLEQNGLARNNGTDGLVDAVNDGRAAGVISLEPLLHRSQFILDDYRDLRPRIGIAALLIGLIGLAVPGRTRWINLGATLVVVGTAGVLASAYIDNARYLIGPMIISMTSATLAAIALFSVARRRIEQNAAANTNETEVSS